MRLCLAVKVGMLGALLSRDLTVIRWAMNKTVCGVKWWRLELCLYLLFLRQMRFALVLCM